MIAQSVGPMTQDRAGSDGGMESVEARIAGSTVLVEIDDPDRPHQKGAAIDGAPPPNAGR